ncbi:hypothetical protein OIU78_002547 [Salix suchowensis]|nr:hypothetical protein OIU78_002547 [Salix suchowensis]
MVRDAGAVFTWGTEACVAFVMRIFAKQMGVLRLEWRLLYCKELSSSFSSSSSLALVNGVGVW